MTSALAHNTQMEGRESSPKQTAVHQPNDDQVSIIRKEFVALTGDHFSAVILNQLMYWTQRVKDFDLLLEEEKNFHPECNVSSRHGWIYKTAVDLIEETMLGISHPTMRKYLKHLIDQGWIDERAHPLDKWNKTTQYRVNIRKLQEDLIAIGRNLPDIFLRAFSSSLREVHPNEHQKAFLLNEESSNVKNLQLTGNSDTLHSNVENLHSNESSNESFLSFPPLSEEISNVRILHSNAGNLHSDVSSFHSNVKNLHSYTYTETTTENKNKEHTQRTCAREFFDEICEIWKKHIGQDVILTEERKRQLNSLLTLHFQNDLSQWGEFCERVKASPFLMGEGARKWRVTLDWVLSRGNLLKILEGNFDNPEILEQKKAKDTQKAREKEIQETLASIEDPMWKKWCTQLIFPPPLNAYGLRRDPISLFDLQGIANAWFDECEDRIIWIASEDERVLNRIYSLQFNILNVIGRDYPKSTCIQTRLKARSPSNTTHTDWTISELSFQDKMNAHPSFNSSSNTEEKPHE